MARRFTLSELAVHYSGVRSDVRQRRVGRGPWPFGYTGWRGIEGMVWVFTLKKFWFLGLGPLRLHALRVRGLRTWQHRSELAAAPAKGEPTFNFVLRCLRLFVLGEPMERVGQRIKLAKDDAVRGIPAGTFGLVEARR